MCGIIRGAGKQRVGAICNILGYYGVGFPIGVSLMFAAKLGIMGEMFSTISCLYPCYFCPYSSFFSFDFYHSINISFLLLKKKTCFVFLRSVDRLVNLCVPAMLIPDFLSNQNELEKCHS